MLELTRLQSTGIRLPLTKSICALCNCMNSKTELLQQEAHLHAANWKKLRYNTDQKCKDLLWVSRTLNQWYTGTDDLATKLSCWSHAHQRIWWELTIPWALFPDSVPTSVYTTSPSRRSWNHYPYRSSCHPQSNQKHVLRNKQWFMLQELWWLDR